MGTKMDGHAKGGGALSVFSTRDPKTAAHTLSLVRYVLESYFFLCLLTDFRFKIYVFST
ncbi:hypothetical protein HanHA300_Chr04g0158301 [Helianthus annuus]|nr:hypothetical protein HanHA300_Chr16g0589501 [Helianthus annuus]KAJ0583003.1 hypothetical protein HanHA300_Chr04g0158301 [Helianthus annuus]